MTRRARAEDLAFFVVGVGLQPSEYWALTVAERDAIVTAYRTANKKR